MNLMRTSLFLFLFNFNCFGMVDYEPQIDEQVEEIIKQNDSELFKKWAICCLCCELKKYNGKKPECYKTKLYNNTCGCFLDCPNCVQYVQTGAGYKIKKCNACCFECKKDDRNLSKIDTFDCYAPPICCIGFYKTGYEFASLLCCIKKTSDGTKIHFGYCSCEF